MKHGPQFALDHAECFEVPLSIRYRKGDGVKPLAHLTDLETYHHVLDLYIWLSYVSIVPRPTAGG